MNTIQDKTSTRVLVTEMVGGEPYRYVSLGDFVVCAPEVCGGRPTFKYTRIEIKGTLDRLAAGEDIDHVTAGYRERVSREAIGEASQLVTRTLLRSTPLSPRS